MQNKVIYDEFKQSLITKIDEMKKNDRDILFEKFKKVSLLFFRLSILKNKIQNFDNSSDSNKKDLLLRIFIGSCLIFVLYLIDYLPFTIFLMLIYFSYINLIALKIINNKTQTDLMTQEIDQLMFNISRYGIEYREIDRLIVEINENKFLPNYDYFGFEINISILNYILLNNENSNSELRILIG